MTGTEYPRSSRWSDTNHPEAVATEEVVDICRDDELMTSDETLDERCTAADVRAMDEATELRAEDCDAGSCDEPSLEGDDAAFDEGSADEDEGFCVSEEDCASDEGAVPES